MHITCTNVIIQKDLSVQLMYQIVNDITVLNKDNIIFRLVTKYNIKITPNALRINWLSCVHISFIVRSFFTLHSRTFAFTVRKRSSNSSLYALTVRSECTHRSLRVHSLLTFMYESRTYVSGTVIPWTLSDDQHLVTFNNSFHTREWRIKPLGLK